MSVLDKFVGKKYRTADYWFKVIPLVEYENRPIKYLEIGAFYGANLLTVADSYGKHPESELFCIDPWEDYEDYPEYKNEQENIYETFLKNVEHSGVQERITAIRGYSNNEIPRLQDDFFDIIYIDGNHEPEYVLEDAVLCYRKLKVGGWLIFDDYGWGGPDLTEKGIRAFVDVYCNRLQAPGILKNMQLFAKKIR